MSSVIKTLDLSKEYEALYFVEALWVRKRTYMWETYWTQELT